MTTEIYNLYHDKKIIKYISNNSQRISNDSRFYCTLSSSILSLPQNKDITISEVYNILEELEKYNINNFKNQNYSYILFSQLENIKIDKIEEQENFKALANKISNSNFYNFEIKHIENEKILNFLIENFDLDNISENNPVEVFIKESGQKKDNLKKLLDKFPKTFSKSTNTTINIFTLIIFNCEERLIDVIDKRHLDQIKDISFIKSVINERELKLLNSFINKGLDVFSIHESQKILECFLSNTKDKELIDKIYAKKNTTVIEDMLSNKNGINYTLYLNNPVVLENFKKAVEIKQNIFEEINIEHILSHPRFINHLKEIIKINETVINKEIDKKSLLQISIEKKNYDASELLLKTNPDLMIKKYRNKLPVETIISNCIKDKKTKDSDMLNLIKQNIEHIMAHKETSKTLNQSIDLLANKVNDSVFKSFLKYNNMSILIKDNNNNQRKMKI